MNKIDLRDTSLRNLPRLLALQAKQNGEAVYLLDDQNSISFEQAERLTDQLATGLANIGVDEGSRVALFLENRVETVLLALAVNKLRAIWVPINTDYKGDWLSGVIQDSQPTVLVTQDSFWQKFQTLLSERQVDNIVLLDGQNDSNHDTKIIQYQTLLGKA